MKDKFDLLGQVANQYYVFCMADQLEEAGLVTKDDGMDIVWEEAQSHYENFLSSPFNVDTKSEIDCIQDYVQLKKLNKEHPTKVVNVSFSIRSDKDDFTIKSAVRRAITVGMDTAGSHISNPSHTEVSSIEIIKGE